jgi:hypothetical protein
MEEDQDQLAHEEQAEEELQEEDIPQGFTVLDAMITCGFNNTIQRAGSTDAQRIATDTFDNDFSTAIYLDEKAIASEIKRYAALPQAAGRILWTAPNRNRIKCFIFWVQDMKRKGILPDTVPFLGHHTVADIQNQTTQLDHFIKRSDQHVSTINVAKLKQENEWYNWKPQFTTLLKGMPGISSVPLSYVLRANPTPALQQTVNHLTYIEQLEAMAPHYGDSYIADNKQVQLLLNSYIDPKNDGAIAMLRQTTNSGDGRHDWQQLCIKYEGQGLNSLSLIEADRTIRQLRYDKDTPTNTFETFTAKLQKAWNAYQDFNQPYTNDQKIRTLLGMTRSSTVLKTAVENLETNLAFQMQAPTYDQIVTSMRTIVSKYNESTQLRVKSVTNTNNKNKQAKQKGGNNKNSDITDPSKLPKGDINGHIRYDRDQKGRNVEINFLISYPKAIWMQLTPEQRRLIANKAREHRESKPRASNRSVSQVQNDDASQASTIASLQAQISTLTNQVQTLNSRNSDEASTLTGSLIGGRSAAGQHRQNQINKVRIINSVHHSTLPLVQHSIPNTLK